jgi:hypothetical protein
MPNKGKKSLSKQAKLGKKAPAKSTAEIARSFAKNDSNITTQSLQTNENQIEVNSSDKNTKVSNSRLGISNNPAIAPVHPNLKGELLRIFATTGVIVVILMGLSFIL